MLSCQLLQLLRRLVCCCCRCRLLLHQLLPGCCCLCHCHLQLLGCLLLLGG
jgi:hypothetical protein